MMFGVMADVLKVFWWTVIGLFRSRASLEAEIRGSRLLASVIAKVTAGGLRRSQLPECAVPKHWPHGRDHHRSCARAAAVLVELTPSGLFTGVH
jgi:hypothetical protein